MVAIGIDLGTTNSCVAVFRNGNIEVIANEHGNRTTPSYVAFTSNERLIGEAAKNQARINPSNTIFGAKRLIGRRYDDVGVQMDLRLWPYTVANDNGKPKILVEFKGEKRSFAPEEISSMVLFRMRQLAEAHLGTPVKDAVVTVPSYFNNAQRHATRAAGSIAGLNILRIINEPTAAALAYGLDRNLKGEKNVLIYDLGGGTIDVSVLTIGEGSLYEVKSTAGNTRLGGDDFDNRLAVYFADDFKKRYGLDIMKNVKAMRKLKCVAEKTKRFLTSATEATVEIDSLFNGIDYFGRITREFFEELCSDLFDDTLRPVQNAITDARLTKNDIHNVILVGASTRIPKVRKMLQDYFGKPPTTSINPDEAVAYGAAIQAAILSGEHHDKFRDLLLVDVVPLSLGVETARGMMFKVIEKNTAIPCRQTKDLTTLEDYQRAMTIEVYEGERALTKDNHLLGAFELKNIPPAPRGVAKVDVTFNVDANGILSVSAMDRSTGEVEGITIKNETRLQREDVEKMIADAEAFRDEDLENKHYLEARNQLETYVYNVKQIITESEDSQLTEDEKMTMLNECKEVIEWLDNTDVNIREEYESKLTELMTRWAKTMSKFYENRLKHRTKRQRS